MTHIHTTAGLDLWIDPRAISKVLTGANGGAAIQGITGGAPEVPQPPSAFLQGLGIAAEFAELTLPGSASVWIRAANAVCVRPPLNGEYPNPAIKAVVNPGPGAQGVTETVQQAAAKLNQAGAQL